jgi:hypothetical protein
VRDKFRNRVQAFIASQPFDRDARAERDALLAEIAAWQAEHVAPFGKLVRARSARFDRGPDAWPALPTDVFRFARVAAHGEDDDMLTFRTSGTTNGARGEHHLAHVLTYCAAAETMAARCLFGAEKRTLLMLAPPMIDAPDSSLSFMLESFEARFGSSTTWAWTDGSIDVDLARGALAEGSPVAVLGTSFALVHFLDTTLAERFPLPPGSLVMQTGGFKGKSREIDARTLRRMLAETFGVAEHAVVSEYGMTELSSQLYGDGLSRGHIERDGLERLMVPPWVRVTPCDPETLRPVRAGEVGVLRIDDVANLDACCSIQTADLGRMEGDRVILLGRSPGATPRGCSLAIEEAIGARK